MPRPTRDIRQQHGFALPLVMASVVLIAIFLATAMTRATIGLGVSQDDVASKRALQAAQAGVRVAINRMNAVSLDLNQLLDPTQQCLANLNGALGILALPAGSNWCPAETEDLGTGAGFSYRVSAVATVPAVSSLLQLGTTDHLLSREIVSTGTADRETRRVYVKVTADGQTSVTSVLLLNLLSSVDLQTYRVEDGSFRECSAEPPNPGDPKSGC